jgi:hypothetical protein
MAAGPAFTVTDFVTVQLVPPREYVIVVVPGIIPAMVPLNSPIEAVAGALLVQLPPITASVYVTGIPTHIADGPMIGPGTGLTVTGVVI